MAKPIQIPRVVVDEITLDGRKIVLFNQEIPVDDVHLDPANPRIANTIALQGGTQGPRFEERIEELLWDDPDVRDLYRQVLVNRGLIERIIIKPDHTVMEGNCRVVVYRRLRKNHPEDQTWSTIPARVLPEDIGEKAVALLLGQMHVMGKNQWSGFEKAGHVYKLHRHFLLTQDEIASRLRMSKSKVNQLNRAFDAMKTYFLPHYPEPANVRKFSYFEELFKKPVLRDWVFCEPDAVKRFADWVGTGKLFQGVQVRELPEILENPDALDALEKKGYAEAKKVLEEENPALSSPLFRKMSEMTQTLLEARLDDIQRARGNTAAQRMVRELKDALSRFGELSGMEM